MTPSSTTLRTLLLLAVGSAMACVAPSASQQAGPAPTPRSWRAVACTGCSRAKIEVEARPATPADGCAGAFVIARLRNANAFPVVFDVVFTTGDMPDSEGYVPRDVRRVSLSAAGDSNAERVVVLALPRVGTARVTALEALQF